MLHVSLFNSALLPWYSKLDVSKAIRDLPSRAPSDTAQLQHLMTDFHGLPILQNDIDGAPPFQTGNTSLLHDTLDGLQRWANTTQLPRRIQQDYHQGVAGTLRPSESFHPGPGSECRTDGRPYPPGGRGGSSRIRRQPLLICLLRPSL
jgi:hypothetical protein